MLEESLKLLVENNKAVLKFDGEVIIDNSNQLKEEAKKYLLKTKKLKV